MNILHMIFSIEKGGAETYLFNILEKMDEDINFFVVCNHKGKNHNKLEKVCNNVEIINMNSPFDIKAAKKIAKYCKENNIDLIQTHFLRENYIAVLSKIFNPKIKVIWTAHLIAENNKIIQFFNKIFSKFVSKIVCVSKAVKKSLEEEGIERSRLKTIYNGVDTEYFKPIKDSFLRQELNINEKTLVLTTISRFNKEKGHSFLIDAIRELKNHIKDFKLLLVGEGEEEDIVREKVEKYNLNDNIIFLGYKENILPILAITDIYLSPSKNEAISFSILEALSCNKVVIATEVGGVPEIFEKGDVGELVPYGEPEEFAKTILHLYNNKEIYESKRRNSRRVVELNFSLKNMVQETFQLYKALSNE